MNWGKAQKEQNNGQKRQLFMPRFKKQQQKKTSCTILFGSALNNRHYINIISLIKKCYVAILRRLGEKRCMWQRVDGSIEKAE